MIDLTTEFGRQANERLAKEEVIWLTTVTPKGVAQPNPVWYYWDGASITVYSKPGSYRIRNIRHNPNVALNLQGADALGNNVVIIQGIAHLSFDYQQLPPDYVKKYIHMLPAMGATVEQLIASYSVEITITPERLRG